MKLGLREDAAVAAETRDPLSFAFVIDAKGKIIHLETDPALRALGWDEALLGRSCYLTVACRDLSGASLCDVCTVARAGGPGAPPWRRPMAFMTATGGEVLARSSRVRRLLKRRLRVEVTV